jgi:hypothetical protein
MAQKKPDNKHAVGYLKANVPRSTEEWFRQKALKEGVPMQALIAPVLNAVARGEIQGGYAVAPDSHGNASRKM